MEYALVKDGEVKAVIVADAAFVAPDAKTSAESAKFTGCADGEWVDTGAEKVGIGWTHDGSNFAPPKP